MKERKLHWTVGDQRKREGRKLYWRTSCGKWQRLHQCAPWGPKVTCKSCRAYMERTISDRY